MIPTPNTASSSTTILHSNSDRAAALGLALLLSACAHSAPDARTEAPAPHLRDAAEHLPADHVEHVDPVPDPERGSDVSLGGILAYADLHSPVLAVARATRSRAE